jgi:hypothetical protein
MREQLKKQNERFAPEQGGVAKEEANFPLHNTRRDTA